MNLVNIIKEIGQVFDALTNLALQIGTFLAVIKMVKDSLKK